MEHIPPIRFLFLQPQAELRPYVRSIWVVESQSGLPARDQLVVPTGCPRLILPFQNSLTRMTDGATQAVNERGAYFSGITDRWVRVRSSARPTGIIGVDFHSEGAHAIFGMSMNGTAHRLLHLEDVFGRRGQLDLEPRVHCRSALKNVALLQRKLLALVSRYDQP